MGIIGALGVPVPRIVAHGMGGDRPAIVMDWCAGRTVLDEAFAHRERIQSLGMSMGRLQARIHALSLPPDLWEDHRTWLSMAGPDETDLQARLWNCTLRDGYPLHLDFHPRNVLCDGHEVTVALDWANATVGDPRADVARTLSIFRYVSAPPTIPASDFYSVRQALERAWMAGYTDVPRSLPHMILFEIWAGVVFVRDMEQYLGRPDFWMELADLDRVRVHVASLKRRAGLRRES